MFGVNQNIGIQRDSVSSLKHMSEMYLNTTNLINNSSPNVSPTFTETSISHPENNLNAFSSSPLFSSTTATTVNSSVSISQTRAECRGCNKGKNEDFSMKAPFLSLQNIYVKKDECKIDEKHLAQQTHTEAISAQNQHKNEISKSLKMFALLASYKYGNDCLNSGRESPVCDIMDDFYCNGYVTDDTNSYEEGRTLKGTSLLEPYHSSNTFFCNDSSPCNWNFNTVNYGNYKKDAANSSTNNKNVAFLKHYFDPNLLMMQMTAPSQYYNSDVIAQNQQILTASASLTDTAITATAVAAANITYNNQNVKKSQKRFGGTKLDKFSAIKHCVFCENNNEPEAVVKSHAVRDSLGRVLCPRLRTYICPICRASGDKAHTVKYCPQKPIITMEDAVRAESLRLAKNLYFKQGMKV